MSGFPKYVPVAQQHAKAATKLKKLVKKYPYLEPVLIDGTKIATTWWGISWNKNLESYADFANRIGRGRSYVRHGYIAHLAIGSGAVDALVIGSGATPYSVRIEFEAISDGAWQHITEICGHSIDSLDELASGNFPKELKSLFTSKGDGLFPSPNDISMACTCPDWAIMCKHVAAVMYGIGTKLDRDPTLFFTLRSAPYEALIRLSVENRLEKMLENSDQKSSRTINEDDIESVFGL